MEDKKWWIVIIIRWIGKITFKRIVRKPSDSRKLMELNFGKGLKYKRTWEQYLIIKNSVCIRNRIKIGNRVIGNN